MADFASIDEVIRRGTNRRVAMKTDNVVRDFMHHDHPKPEAPMALYAANYFKVVEIIEMILLSFKFNVISQGLSSPLSYGLSEMNFINLPRGRRLVPVPAASLKANLNACYHPEMDLTAAELPLAGNDSDLSLILILPGRQADFVAGGLGILEDKINLGRESVQCSYVYVMLLQYIL